MFEAYSIGVTLKLNNLISEQLVLLSEEFVKLDGLVATLGASLKKIGAEAPGVRAIARAGDATAVAMDRATRSAMNLERQIIGLKAAGDVPGLPVLTPLPGGGGRGAGGGGGSGGGGRGGHIGGHGNLHMGPSGVGVSSVGMGLGADAFVPLAVSAGMVWGGHALYESAKDLNTEMQRFKLFGLSDKINAEAFKFVADMKVYGTSQAERMRQFTEAQGVFRESGLDDSHALEAAKMAAPVLAKIQFATEALEPELQGRMRASAKSMLRYIEMSGGLKDAATFERLANFGWRMVQTSGGTVDWEQLRQFRAVSGVAGRRISDEGMAAMEPLISELKGSRAAVGLRTAFNRINGIIKIPNQAAHELVDAGLWDKSKIVFNSMGGIKQFTGNPLKTADEFQESPTAWYEKYILPMYEKKKLSAAERDREDAMLFGSTGGAEFSLLRAQLPAVHRSVAAQSKALSINQSVDESRKGLTGQEVEFTNAWKDFKTQLGTVALPTFSAMLRDGATVLRLIGDFIREHKGIVDAMKNMLGAASNTIPALNVVNAVKKLPDMWEAIKAAHQAPAPTHQAAVPGSSRAMNDAWAQQMDEWRKKNGKSQYTAEKPASTPAPAPIHNHFYVDSKKVAEAIVGDGNMVNAAGLNPLESRPMPGTPAMGY